MSRQAQPAKTIERDVYTAAYFYLAPIYGKLIGESDAERDPTVNRAKSFARGRNFLHIPVFVSRKLLYNGILTSNAVK